MINIVYKERHFIPFDTLAENTSQTFFVHLVFTWQNGLGLCALSEVGIHTCKVDTADIFEKQCAIDSVHLGAKANFSRTEVFVHIM